VDGGPAILVELTGTPRHARVARVTVAACAALEDFSVERIDDIRLLVDEVFNAMVGAGARRVRFSVDVWPSRLEVAVRSDGGRMVGDSFDLLGVLADAIAPGWSIGEDAEGVSFTASLCAAPA
jgi:anti-sigma regulatory factor (Ser/Thr protein kinase)